MSETDLRDGLVTALRQAAVRGELPATLEPLPLMSIADAVMAVRDGERERLEAELDSLRATLREWATRLARGTGVVPAVDIAWKLRQIAGDGHHGPADARTPVTAATEAHGETTEAQEARE